jgi:homoserine dehydrogenase
MPIVRVLGDALAGDRVVRIDAILNGTSNVVLSRMEAGSSLDEAIAEACAAGFAESDPSDDLDGADAAAKLAVLCGLGFGVRVAPASIDTRSTAHVGAAEFAKAKLRGGTIRQIARAAFDPERGHLEASVAPSFVESGSLFARTVGPRNAAIVSCEYAGDVTLAGQGVGGAASASAILGDVLAIARDRAAIVPAPVLVAPRTISGLSDSPLAEAV